MGDLQPGGDARQNWKKINELASLVRTLQMEVARLREEVQALRRKVGDQATDRFPFRVYWLASNRRTAPDAQFVYQDIF
jgi:hypothetical protein